MQTGDSRNFVTKQTSGRSSGIIGKRIKWPWFDPFLLQSALKLKRCSVRKDQILPQQRIIGRPFCVLCKSQMWLAYIEPDEPDHDKRTFECPACPNVRVEIVRYRSQQNGRPDQGRT